MTTEATGLRSTGSGWKPDWKPMDACPTCGGLELHPVFEGELMNFLCPLCMSCWHVELGFIHRISPETCPGCQYQLACLENQLDSAAGTAPR